MKEDKIIAVIGFYGSFILGLTIENDILAGFVGLQSILWVWRYAYLLFEKDKKK